MNRIMGSAMALLLAGAAQAQAPAPEPNWGELLRKDARALHAILKANHPGAVDPENPGFSRVLEDGLKLALRRAETAKTAAEWSWALREYGAAFEDGHLNVQPTRDVGVKPVWPGFVTAYRGADQVVVARADEQAPPLGARLISCDGVAAPRLAEQAVGRAYGRWRLESQRVAHGWRVFVNSNPYAPRPERCLFDHEGRRFAYVLPWRGITNEALQPYLKSLPRAHRADTGLRRLDDGTVWIAVGSFATEPGNTEKLKALLAAVETDAPAIRTALRIVFDLRGNDGGSSAWSNDLARLIWGEPYLAYRAGGLGATGVEWRVSEANIETARALKEQMLARSRDVSGSDTLIAGLTQAKARGEVYWRSGFSPKTAAPEAPSLTSARVFVLTDGACFSACLDAVDLWKALGAVQVGRETSADTLYMENWGTTLPSGMAGVGYPMKVYRGRKRGNNETHKPRHVFEGEIGDTAALQAWIAKL